MPKKYTDKYLLLILCQLAIELGRTPTEKYLNARKDLPSTKPYINHFGSFNNAIHLAGLEENLHHYNEIELIDAINRFVDEFNRTSSQTDMDTTNGYPSGTAFVKHFGTFNNAIRAAGFNPAYINKYTDEELLEFIDAFVIEFGHPPGYDEISNTPGYPNATAYIDHFGTFSTAKRMLGYECKSNVRLTGNEQCELCGATTSIHSWHTWHNMRICSSCWYSTPEELTRQHDRRNNSGFKPINDWFPGSHFHHLHLGSDHSIGVYIPIKLHRSVWHSAKTGKGMDEINHLAIDWLWDQIRKE